MVLVQAHLRLLARVWPSDWPRSPDLLVVSVPVPVPISVPAFPCFPVAPNHVLHPTNILLALANIYLPSSQKGDDAALVLEY